MQFHIIRSRTRWLEKSENPQNTSTNQNLVISCMKKLKGWYWQIYFYLCASGSPSITITACVSKPGRPPFCWTEAFLHILRAFPYPPLDVVYFVNDVLQVNPIPEVKDTLRFVAKHNSTNSCGISTNIKLLDQIIYKIKLNAKPFIGTDAALSIDCKHHIGHPLMHSEQINVFVLFIKYINI